MVVAALPLLSPWPGDALPARGQSAYRARPAQAMNDHDAAAEERGLVEAAQRGDRAALQQLLARVSQPLYAAVILPRVGHPADAEDILREALVRGMEKLDTFRWTGVGVFPWFRQIAVNLVIDHARRRQRRGRLEERLERHVQATEPVHHAGAETALIEAEERAGNAQTLAAAMGTLSERYRRAITLRLIEERSREECAATMGVTLGNFDVILHRSLAALRKAYGA